MSIDATRWAWQQKVTATQKLVLLSLADRANERHSCYPSTARLCADTGLHRVTIFEALDALEKLGLVVISRALGQCNIYRLIGVPDRHQTSTNFDTGHQSKTSAENRTCGQNKTSTKNSTGSQNDTSAENRTTQCGKPHTHQCGKPHTESTNESINNPPIENSGGENGFSDFWEAYPNHDGEADAKRAWQNQKPPLQEILTALQWQTQLPRWKKDNGAFIPLAVNYLKGERWKDAPPKSAKLLQFSTASAAPKPKRPDPEKLEANLQAVRLAARGKAQP